MFTAVNAHTAKNNDGVVVTLGKVVRYHEEGRVLELGSMLCPPYSKDYEALFTIYYPDEVKWLEPHHEEPIGHDTGKRIERCLVEALHALNCEVHFTTPVKG